VTSVLTNCKFHHLGLAVEGPEQALVFLAGQGYQVGETVFDPEQNVNLIWCTHPTMPTVEVIYQSDPKGPLESVLRNRRESFYHVCYAVQDVPNVIASLKNLGLRVICVAGQKPSVLFQGQTVGFYYVSGFGLVELVCPVKEPVTS
jgi:hypothetical protein